MDSRLSGRRVLVVEDELLVSWVVQDLLTDLGCVVLGPAATIDEAMAIIDGQPLDAAVLDLNLDGEMSYPVADALTARGVPYVLATGYHPDRIPQAYQAFPVLQKPLSPRELRETLSRMSPPEAPPP